MAVVLFIKKHLHYSLSIINYAVRRLYASSAIINSSFVGITLTSTLESLLEITRSSAKHSFAFSSSETPSRVNLFNKIALTSPDLSKTHQVKTRASTPFINAA